MSESLLITCKDGSIEALFTLIANVSLKRKCVLLLSAITNWCINFSN